MLDVALDELSAGRAQQMLARQAGLERASAMPS